MSRIGKLPVPLMAGTSVKINGPVVIVTGKLGTLQFSHRPEVKISLIDNNSKVQILPINDSKTAKSMWGLTRSLVNNMVQGVNVGFTQKLEVNGVGYRCSVDSNILTLILGFSHEIKYAIPSDISIVCEKPTLLVISGIDKQKVGQVAAIIRKLRKPEPYKGKGIRYENEKVLRKVGKKK